MKKTILLMLSVCFIAFSNMVIAADKAPVLNCYGLPGCVDSKKEAPSDADVSKNISVELVGNVIGAAIDYVAVFAVLALMFSGIMYLLSGGEEEKVKKAKNWIIWSLVGVFLSISAWAIINILNTLSIPSGI